MAMPVEFREFTPKNSREDLMRRLEQAPEEHAEALLAAYDLLQRTHDKGLLDVASGLLSAGDTVVSRLADAVSSKEVVNAMRIGLMLGNLIGSINPDRIQGVLSNSQEKPPSLWAIFKMATQENARTGLATALGFLTVLGAAVRQQKKN